MHPTPTPPRGALATLVAAAPVLTITKDGMALLPVLLGMQ